MKKLSLVALAVLGATAAPAAVLYVNLSDLVVPYTDEGIYVNIFTGATATAFPSDFDDAPWLNLYYGGSRIYTSNLLRPMASTASYNYDDPEGDSGSYFLNVSFGTTIDSGGVFVNTGAVSVNHIGAAGNQFQSGQRGYLAFEYQASSVSGTAYGWISISPSLTGSGVSYDLAYSDTPGEALLVGAVPEPASFAGLAGLAGLAFAGLRRRRAA